MSDDYLDTIVQFQDIQAVFHSKNIVLKNIHLSGRESGFEAEFRL